MHPKQKKQDTWNIINQNKNIEKCKWIESEMEVGKWKCIVMKQQKNKNTKKKSKMYLEWCKHSMEQTNQDIQKEQN
jgi:hypothetical protein